MFQGVASGSLYFRGSHQGRCVSGVRISLRIVVSVSGGRIRVVVFQGVACH